MIMEVVRTREGNRIDVFAIIHKCQALLAETDSVLAGAHLVKRLCTRHRLVIRQILKGLVK